MFASGTEFGVVTDQTRWCAVRDGADILDAMGDGSAFSCQGHGWPALGRPGCGAGLPEKSGRAGSVLTRHDELREMVRTLPGARTAMETGKQRPRRPLRRLAGIRECRDSVLIIARSERQ